MYRAGYMLGFATHFLLIQIPVLTSHIAKYRSTLKLLQWLVRLQEATKQKSTDLDLITHRAFASNHDLAASVHLQLLGSHASRTQNSSDEVELNTSQAQR